MKTQLLILGYHKIGPPSPGAWETWYYVPAATFLAHLHYLRENGWVVLDALAAKHRLVWKQAAAVTRSDGKVLVRDTQGETATYDDVVLACHGNEALAFLDSGENYELMLSDLMMAGMDGSRLFMRRTSSAPSSSGIIKSLKMRSMPPFSNAASASFPLEQATTV